MLKIVDMEVKNTRVKDLTGQRFGRLVVIGRAGSRNHSALWNCQCACGNQIEVISSSLNNGTTKSCGCLRKDVTRARKTTHGMYGTKIYNIWKTMIQRCGNPKAQHYAIYGDRNIHVCEEWLNFETFHEWAMASGYTESLSIDRIDNDKGYSPTNCKFSTQKEQCNNKRNNIYLEHNGECKTLTQWSETTGIHYRTLQHRIKNGWCVSKALESPVRKL